MEGPRFGLSDYLLVYHEKRARAKGSERREEREEIERGGEI